MPTPQPPYLGAAYYPEDWPLEQIDADIALMQQAGMNVMRIGEFAWSRMEPEEGKYDFDWLHLVVDKLGKAGLATIMGTPTCTPPVWLSSRYPEILVVGDNGVPWQHGGRRHACPNSPVYREHCERIVTRLAQEFGRDRNVIGWQLDNEVYPQGRGCFCPVCRRLFADLLRARFGTVERLNAAWCLNLFSQNYQSFAQVPPPRNGTWHHPSLLLEWMNFQGDSYVEFCRAQAEVLHRLATQPVGTDMMPVQGVNYHRMHRHLDLVQFNHYNTMDNLWTTCFWMDGCRPLKSRPFWNTETATCWNGSTAANGYREPGFCRANSWLPFALGGEANLFWLWRAHWAGHELMHGSVVSSAGRPLHVMSEVQDIAAGLTGARSFLNGTRPTPSRLALHFSTHAWWTFEHQAMVNGFKYAEALLQRVYRPAIQAHFRPDVIDPAADLSPYRLLLTPFLPWLGDGGLKDRLAQWIEAGGTWLVGPLSDTRNEEAAKYRHAPYGCLEEWAGVYGKYEIPGDPRDFGIQWRDGRLSQGSVWYDAFELRGAEALATYTEGPMKGLAAVVQKRMGRGRIVLSGTMPRPEDLQRLILDLGKETGVEPVADASSSLLVVPREGLAGRGAVVVEMENRPARLTLARPAVDLLTGARLEGVLDLAPYSVLVLQEQ